MRNVLINHTSHAVQGLGACPQITREARPSANIRIQLVPLPADPQIAMTTDGDW
jgi:hypothetical protein